ncbi:MAG: flagellar basal body rod protein FlgB [Proteobacteria bacterium]|nr:flagellar basal body rod protein FlgB [Pseudomonadota bacterium]
MNNMTTSLFGRTVQVMSKALNLRLSKHGMISSNLANMDVPGYRLKDLKFEKAMQEALGPAEGAMEPSRTHATHLPRRGIDEAEAAARRNVVYSEYGRDEKNHDLIDIDQEMNKLAKNHLVYNATVQMLAKELEVLKYAITEGGRS